MINFFVVIPTYNSENYLDSCLSSILTQTGNFNLHVHIQDKLSSDNTINIISNWINLIENTNVLLFKNKKLTYDTKNDESLYCAIAESFNKYVKNDSTILTWLGSDDLLSSCSLSTAASIFYNNENILWITGIRQLIDKDGNLYNPQICQSYSRFNLICGNHDGRKKEFVQQEGTFWRSSLYFSVNGINTDYKYAGDYDLWIKFSQKTAIHTVDFQLANFRSRPNQVSNQTDKYYDEVDMILRKSGNVLDDAFDINASIFEAQVLQRYSQEISWENKKRREKIFCGDMKKIMRVENIKTRFTLLFGFFTNLLFSKLFFVSHSARKFIIRILFFPISIKK